MCTSKRLKGTPLVEVSKCSVCVENLRVLALKSPVNIEEVKRAYREMAQILHPDRFESEPKIRARSEEQFKNLQASYRELMEHLPAHAGPAVNPSHGSWTGLQELASVARPFADNTRFFVHPWLPAELLPYVSDLCQIKVNEVVAFVDSRSGNDLSFLAICPEFIHWKPPGFRLNSIKRFLLRDAEVQLRKGGKTATIFDRLADDLFGTNNTCPVELYVNGSRLAANFKENETRKLHGMLVALQQATIR